MSTVPAATNAPHEGGPAFEEYGADAPGVQGPEEGRDVQAGAGPGAGQAQYGGLGKVSGPGVVGDGDQGGRGVVQDPGAGLHGGGVGVDDDPQRLGDAVDAAYRQLGVVGAGGARADEHGVGLGAQPVDVGAGLG